jgi:hypothetical protein
MPKEKNTQITEKLIGSATKEFLEISLQKMDEILKKPKEEPDKFFRNGIELISLTLKVEEIVTVELKIAGPKPQENLLEENQEVVIEKNDSSALEK